ncbi:AB hydrolase-1 domain-containing protein [[Candida] zeylanoides]
MIIDAYRLRDVANFRVQYSLPLDYTVSSSPTISVCGTLTVRYDSKLHAGCAEAVGRSVQQYLPVEAKLVVFFQGGPGFPCAAPTDKDAVAQELLKRGYSIFYLDQRGTGYSSALDAEGLQAVGDVDEQLEYVLHFRADSIVEDAERIRAKLVGSAKWSVMGQSYGGFCIFTYLSRYPASIREAIITGGVPPVNYGPDDVYTATYERTRERNVHYYRKYPHDVARVRAIAAYLASTPTKLPNGGTLSVERFQTLGLGFGATSGTDRIHQLVTKLWYDLQAGKPRYSTLAAIEQEYSFDTNVVYALFQEAIYCDGNNPHVSSSGWSANRLRYATQNANFVYGETDGPLYFTGEMVYKSMFDDYAELRALKPLAHAIHAHKEWSPLYDVEVLARQTWAQVPIVASTYVYDQYVDFDLTRAVKKEVFRDNGNLRQYITSDYFHNGLRASPEVVLKALFDLLNGEID